MRTHNSVKHSFCTFIALCLLLNTQKFTFAINPPVFGTFSTISPPIFFAQPLHQRGSYKDFFNQMKYVCICGGTIALFDQK